MTHHEGVMLVIHSGAVVVMGRHQVVKAVLEVLESLLREGC